MLKRLFQFSHENDGPHPGAYRTGSADHGSAVIEQGEDENLPRAKGRPPEEGLANAKAASFDQVYQNAAVKPARIPYSILKVADMVNSSHLGGMSPETKRCALLMALEAAGTEIEDLLQDAVVRQRALNDHETALQEKLQKFETTKAEENRQIQAELDRLTKQYLSRIQGNLNGVAHEQDEIRAWQQRKQRESERITEAATFCVPQGGTAGSPSLTAVLERANTHRR
jgi:hypothetical protein